MLEKIATYIDQHRLFPESGTIIVAVSGGADSLCLLHVLNRLCGNVPEARYPAVRLHVAHLNHKLRGEASYQDAAFIVQLADSWGLPVTIGEIDVPALARQEGRAPYNWRAWAARLMDTVPPGAARLHHLSSHFPAPLEADAQPHNFVARLVHMLEEAAAERQSIDRELVGILGRASGTETGTPG